MALGLRILASTFGALFIWNGIQWIFMPEQIAQQLGMPLLSGMGGSTQIGDFTSFFLVGGALVFIGLRRGHSVLLIAPALLVGAAAVFRTLAYLLGEAPFASFFITFEVLMAASLFAAYHYLPKLDNQ